MTAQIYSRDCEGVQLLVERLVEGWNFRRMIVWWKESTKKPGWGRQDCFFSWRDHLVLVKSKGKNISSLANFKLQVWAKFFSLYQHVKNQTNQFDFIGADMTRERDLQMQTSHDLFSIFNQSLNFKNIIWFFTIFHAKMC